MIKKLLRTIVLPALLLISAVAWSQQVTRVTGKVTDAKDGSPLSGASVVVKGTNNGASTDANGVFTVMAPDNAKLVISSVGFGTVEVSVTGAEMNIAMTATAGSQLNEVVVVGYGTTKKKDLTGAITTVSSKDFQKGSITTPEQLILGKVPGVSITSNGGAPGSGSTIRIRGGASLSASNDPLIVIDGVPIDNSGISGAANALSLINPNDIESFNILKDASATAIYGSRASNGVIIITTKKGKTGAPKFNFNTQVSASVISKKADIFSADEFRDYINKSGKPTEISKLGTASTDWQDEIYQTAISTDNNLSVSGGIPNMPYRVSAGYLNQSGILKTGKLERGSLGINVSPRLMKDHLKIDINLKGSVSHTRFANESAIGNAVNFDPTQPVMSGNSRFGGYYEILDPSANTGLKSLAPRNPLALLELRNDQSDVQRSIGNAQIDYKFHFLPDLHANLNVGYDVSKGFGTIEVGDSAAVQYHRYKDSKGNFHGGTDNLYLQKKQNKLLEFYLNYAKDIKAIDSRVDAVAGYAYQDFLTYARNFSDYTSDDSVVSRPNFNFDKPRYTLISYYGRLNYSYKGKYLLTGTIRTDGSSRFNKNNRWGVFPSAAFAWNIGSEPFLKASRSLNNLKLRLGYGETGQQDGIGYFDYLSYYNLSNQQAQYQLGDTYYYLYRPGVYYANRKWEQTATYNAGLDFGFLQNRISGSVDVYYKKTTNLLNEIDQPAGTNFGNKVVANVGSMENRGIEFSINTVPVRKSDFTWDLGFNFTYNKNEITRLTISADPTNPGNPQGGISGGTGQNIQINSTGYSRNVFYVYKQVYDAAGKPIDNLFDDINRDGIIDSKDLYRYKKPDPDFFMGAYTNVTFKKWNAGFTMRANIGNYVYNNVASSTGTVRNIYNPLGYLNNGSRNVLESNFSGDGEKYFLSDYYIQNASFLRMDNITVGYNAGRIFNNKAGLRFNGTVQNVFVITKYNGLDPEISGGIDNNFYPRPRVFVLGANLDF